MKDLARLKGKGIESNVQPSQDNRDERIDGPRGGGVNWAFFNF